MAETVSLAAADSTNVKVGSSFTLPATYRGLGDRIHVFVRNPANQDLTLFVGHRVADPATGSVTGVASTDLFTQTAHGLAAGDEVRFSGLTGGAGLTVGQTYFVIASGLTANDFKVSTTSGGGTIDLTSDLSAGTLTKMRYAPLSSPSGAVGITIPRTASQPAGVVVIYDGGLLDEGGRLSFRANAAVDATYSISLKAWIRN